MGVGANQPTAQQLAARRIAMAFKSLAIRTDMPRADTAVAAVMLDHRNAKTGRCDPGQGRIARLLGLDSRTVQKSIARLTREPPEGSGLFKVVRNGGGGQRNLYVPVWEKFEEHLTEWSAKMRNGRRRTPGQKAGTTPGQKAGTTPGQKAGQTYLKKPTQETYGVKRPDPDQPEMLFPIRGGSSRKGLRRKSGGAAAREAATTRLSGDMVAQGEELHAAMIAIHTQDLGEQAIDAEVKLHGAGVIVYLEALDRVDAA